MSSLFLSVHLVPNSISNEYCLNKTILFLEQNSNLFLPSNQAHIPASFYLSTSQIYPTFELIKSKGEHQQCPKVFSLSSIFYNSCFQMIRESSWKKQNSILQQDATNLSILKKQISKQSEIDASVQLSISDKIETLKRNATLLAKKLENEKHKNIELQTIINHLKNNIQKQKMNDASFRDSSNFQNLSGMDNRLKKLEYDLGQLNGKANRISQAVQEKKSKISQNRTQRVIDSGIFRNIEKELIESSLKFKKLLIQKIKHQKEYQKFLSSYEGLKQHAQNYKQQKLGAKSKSGRNVIPDQQEQGKSKQKFTNIQVSKQSNIKPHSMTLIEQQQEFQDQKKMILIKKLLAQTGLDDCQELLHSFFHIDEENDKCFNEMSVYTDQSNEIEKYLNDIQHQKDQNKLQFYETKKQPSKNQILKNETKKIKAIIATSTQEIKCSMDEIANFFKQENFLAFTKAFSLPNLDPKEGFQHFDDLKDLLKQLETKMSEVLSQQQTIKQEKISNTSRTNQQERLQDLIGKIKKTDQNLKVMKKEQFQQQYQKILKNSNSKSLLTKPNNTRHSNMATKK